LRLAVEAPAHVLEMIKAIMADTSQRQMPEAQAGA
jgi:hypothetical protein